MSILDTYLDKVYRILRTQAYIEHLEEQARILQQIQAEMEDEEC